MAITKHTDFNSGGINSLRIALLDNVSIFNIVSQTRVSAISFSTGTWEDIYFTPNKAKLAVSPKTDKNGSYYEVACNILIPKLREDVIAILENYKNRKLIVNIIDKNNNSILLGLPEQPMRLYLDADINQTVKEGSFMAVKFAGKQIPFPYFFY